MHILYLADIRFPIERANGIQSMETCYALAARGHETTMLVRMDTTRPPRDPFDFYGLQPLEHLRIERIRVAGPPLARRVVYTARALARATRGGRYDLVFTRDLGLAALLCRGEPRVPVVYESHAYAPAFAAALPEMLGGGRRPSNRKLERLAAYEQRVWRRAAGYVTITRALCDELRQRLGSGRQNIEVVPDGVRLAPSRTFAWRPPGMFPVLTYVGHLYPWKGVDVLLRAAATLKMVKVTIVGGHPGEPDLARLQSLAHDLALGYRATFTGQVPPRDVPGHLCEADVLILPNTDRAVSRTYTSPLKLFEYMAAGRPIVASDLPALREVLRDEENALLVPPGDPDALASAAMRLIRDPELAQCLARTAFDDVEAYSWAKRAERLEALFEKIVTPVTQR